MSALQQYALLFGMVVATVGLALSLAMISRSLGRVRQEKARDVPAASGELSPVPVWVRYYGYALLFLAFDTEMAFMYPYAVVYKELGLVALLDMGVFLMVIFLGLLYGWSQGALRRQ